jgi:aryl-alcohol dehydrogenase-like predicted oxidoreductase
MLNRRTLLKSAAVLAATPTSLLTHSVFAQSQNNLVSSLITKSIPSTGEKIPVIGIGTNRYGVGDDPAAMAPLKETLAKFAEYGGKLIDTAASYGSSESVIGNLVEQLNFKDQFFIATKCDSSGGQATRTQIASSAAKLKSGPLDLVYVHNIRNWQENLAVLREAKAAKQIRYLGITTSRSSQYDDFAKVLESEPLDFVQVNYSLDDREAEKRILKLAADKGVAVVANLTFGRGRLFSAVKGHDIPEWAAEFDATSWARLFLKYVVSHPAITCAIPGTTKIHHLEDNIGAAMGRLPNAEQRQQIEAFYNTL